MYGITDDDVDTFFNEGVGNLRRAIKTVQRMLRATPFAACMNVHTYGVSDVTDTKGIFYPFHYPPVAVVPGLQHPAQTDSQYYTDNLTAQLLGNYVAVRNPDGLSINSFLRPKLNRYDYYLLPLVGPLGNDVSAIRNYKTSRN